MNVNVKLEVAIERVLAHLNNWIELNDDSWISGIKPVLPENLTKADFRPGGKLNPHECYNSALAVIATTPEFNAVASAGKHHYIERCISLRFPPYDGLWISPCQRLSWTFP